MKKLSSNEIIKRYDLGERDFSGVECIGGWLSGVNLSGASFKGANLSFTSFQGSDLRCCDFSQANLTWTNFVNADLTKAKMRRTKLNFAKLNEAILEGTDLSGADLSYALLFNVNLSAAKTDDATFTMAATHVSQLREQGYDFAMQSLERTRPIIPQDLFGRIKFGSSQLIEKARSVRAVSKIISTYISVKNRFAGFFNYSQTESYHPKSPGYSGKSTVYTSPGTYGPKKRRWKRTYD